MDLLNHGSIGRKFIGTAYVVTIDIFNGCAELRKTRNENHYSLINKTELFEGIVVSDGEQIIAESTGN